MDGRQMTEQNTQQARAIATMKTGGQVAAIVPQSIEEVFRVAKGVVQSGLAPYSMVAKKTPEEQISAVAIVIMSGAELGLKPMAALRAFTVINGKPALYGDGLINVVRASGRVKRLRTGCDERAGKLVGWCEAERSDTGESSRVEFSQDDAVRAGLWQDKALIDKEVWENRQKVLKKDQPNDSPWYRYPKRMLAWRAAGYCLRELFGDVLGGIRDEFEEREIAEAHFEEIPHAPSNQPPAPPPDEPEEDATDVVPFDAEAFAANIIAQVGKAEDEHALVAFWEGEKVDAMLDGHAELLDECYEAREKRMAAFDGAEEPADDDSFSGDQ